ncbi:hypothetical protein NIIDMKKI_31650 [Mycobacterium kansasii]|uniref:Uncharacterized protein n=1 Tax=Mycobacterium kansasii TaxID=1768 RepID=A0A7G1IEG3_MYCKA|nr:hypothetical protein NIIDMKKI_31650 [Mycobacterium kansasii]
MTDVLVIDAEGLDRLSCNAKTDPSTGKKTLKAKTVCESGFRNMTYVRDLAPMLVGEPPRCWVTTRRPTLGDDSGGPGIVHLGGPAGQRHPPRRDADQDRGRDGR